MVNKIFYFIYYRVINVHFERFTPIRAAIIMGFVGKRLKSLVVRPGVNITGYRKLALGHHVSINHNCFVSAEGGLTIGNYVSIGHGTSILTSEHSFDDMEKPIKYQPVQHRPVFIQDNVWIGANVTILGGVTIASGSVVAAGAVVNKSITEKNSIVGGVPAKKIKSRIEDSR